MRQSNTPPHPSTTNHMAVELDLDLARFSRLNGNNYCHLPLVEGKLPGPDLATYRHRCAILQPSTEARGEGSGERGWGCTRGICWNWPGGFALTTLAIC